MRILVTGSVGFLGQSVVRELRTQGHFIIGVDRREESCLGKSSSDIFLCADLLVPSVFALDSFDLCIHLASEVGGFLYNATTNELEERESTILSNVASWCRSVSCKRIIYVSTINVFEFTSEYVHAPVPQGVQRTPYARAKALGENLVQDLFEEFVIVRPTNIFGAGQLRRHERIGESHVIPDLLHKMSLDKKTLEVLGNGEQRRNFIHVNDVVHFIVKVLSCPKKGWYNLRSDITLRIADVARELVRQVQGGHQIVFVPEYMKYEPEPVRDFDLAPLSELGWRPQVSSLTEGLRSHECSSK